MPRLAGRCQKSFVAIVLCVTVSNPTAYGAERLLTAHLAWTAPSASLCPNGATIAQAVELRLARRVFVESQQADVFLTVAIEPKGTKWSAALELLDSTQTTLGTRYVESASDDCAALGDVLPIVIALLVDASRSYVRLELPAPSYQAPVKTLRATITSPKRTERTSLQPDAFVRLGWAVLAEGVYGLLPEAAPGISLIGFIEPPRFHVPVEFWLGALLPTSSEKKEGLRLSLFHAGLRLCPNLWRGTLHFALCAGASAGNLQAFGRGFDVNESAANLYVDARTTAQLDIPIVRPWFTRFEAGSIFPLIRRRFVGEPAPEVRTLLHRPAAIVPRIAIGIGVGFE